MNNRWRIVGVVAIAVSWLTANLLTLTAYPPLTCDEVSYSSPAAQFLLNGNWGTQTDAGRDGLDKNVVALGRLFVGSIALSFSFLGRSLFAARLVSLMAWAFGIVGVFVLGRRLYGSHISWLSAALMAVSWMPLLQGHVARPDMALASGVVWVAVLLHVALESPSTFKLAGLGIAAGLLVEIHLNGIHFIVVVCIFVGLFALRQRWPWRWGIVFGSGLLAAGLIWMTLHIWAAPPPALTGQLTKGSAILGQLLGLLSSAANLPDFIIRNYLWGSGPGLYTGLLALAGTGVAIWQRTRADKFLLGFTALSLLTFGVFKLTKPAYYAILWIPLLLVFSARGLGKTAEVLPLWRGAARRPLLFSGCVLSIYLAGCAYLLIKFSDHSFDRITSQLQSVVEPGAVVFGDPRAWFALPNRTIIDNLELAKTQITVGHNLTEAEIYHLLATTYKPDYLFIGPNLTCFASPSPEAQLLNQVADKHCQPVAAIVEPWYQPSTLYQCDFANPDR